ncbi:bifunctional 3'-5' exonuclease/DNA polymerase, partial [Xanthomonas citri pv. citri]|nr:bifunctional 3'-5' exonuclease/DNA polymerase [Xanthomonas citri pv. citri]
GDAATPLGSCPAGSVAGLVAGLPARLGVDPGTVRWVLADVGTEYTAWLAAGVRVDRCWDLALVQRILRHAATAPGSGVRYTPVAQL